MARPVGANAGKTRARILRAASALFTQHGRAGASTRAIARKAKVSLATVHHHFGTKQGLYDACVDGTYDAFDGLQEELTAALQQGDLSPAAAVAETVRRSYRFALRHRTALRLTTRDAIDAGELDPARRARLLLPGLEEGASLLAAATGLPEHELRLSVRSVSYLIVRYALTAPKELALVLGLDGGTVDDLHERVEAHLVRLALGLVGLPGATP